MNKQSYYFDYKSQLEGEYLNTFEKIEEYCQMEPMDDEEFNESMNYLIDIFLNAQKDGMTVQKIIGGDIKSFCRCFLSHVSTSSRIRALLDQIRSCAVVMLFCCVLFYIIPAWGQGQSLSAIMSSPSETPYGWVLGVLLSVVLDAVSHRIIKHIILKAKRYRKWYTVIVNLLVYASAIGGLCLIPDFKTNLPMPPFGVVPAVCIAVWMVCLLLRGFLNLTGGRPFFAKGIHMGEHLSFRQNVLRSTVEEFRKKYEKKNKKLCKQGKPEQTKEQFMQEFYRQNKIHRIVVWLCCIIVAVIYLGLIFCVGMESAPLDTAIFAIILTAMYLVIMWPFVIYPYRIRKTLQDILQTNHKTFWDEDVWDYLI